MDANEFWSLPPDSHVARTAVRIGDSVIGYVDASQAPDPADRASENIGAGVLAVRECFARYRDGPQEPQARLLEVVAAVAAALSGKRNEPLEVDIITSFLERYGLGEVELMFEVAP